LLHAFTQRLHALLLALGAVEQDPRPARNAQGCMPIAQQFLQGDFIFAFQHEWVWLSAAHGCSPETR